MEHFLDTERTIGKGLGFDLFGGVHLAWLAVTVLVIFLSCLHYRRLTDTGKDRWKKTVALFLIADEIFKLVLLLWAGILPRITYPCICAILILWSLRSMRGSLMIWSEISFMRFACLPPRRRCCFLAGKSFRC